ncbi:uncharacterized protein [Engystomops pustulosus]|uniref:uncharacterized protein isoform X2 n=1 Tax=Engystomops pustulosus TaxID=76066 RepID=UPI003AFA94BD
MRVTSDVTGAGNLTLLNVTRRISGKYRITVYSPNTGEEVYSHNYTLHVQAPVSEPLLNLSCRLDGGLDIVCKSDAGDQPSFSILVNGELLKENSLSWRSMGGFAEVNDTVTSPGPWNITCSVRNGVSQRGIWKSPVTCPVPLSDPVIKAQCLDDGSPRISCSVENGTDPIFSLSVNGTVVQIDVTEVNVTLSSPGSGSAHCSVRNNLGEKQKNLTFRACPVPPSVPVLKFSCHNGSLEVSCMTEKGTDLVFSLSVNGEIISENTTKDERRTRAPVSSPGPWDVHCSVRNHLQEKNATQIFQACPLPLSVPIITTSCQSDGSARVACEVENENNATYSWIVNGEIRHGLIVPNITLNAIAFTSGAVNVSCSAQNSYSQEHSNDTYVFCEAPLSDPVMKASCLSNGSAVVTCWVVRGSAPTFLLTVNREEIDPPYNRSSPLGFNYTLSTKGPWNISCSVEKFMKSVTNTTSHSCPVASASLCLSCLQKSLIGGFVALVVTTSPLFIAAFYIGRNTIKEQ